MSQVCRPGLDFLLKLYEPHLEAASQDRIALRPAGGRALDDVYVHDVSMFRAEMLDKDHLWLCCNLPGTGVDGDRATFEVIARGGKLEFKVVETPGGVVTFVQPAQ